MQEPAYHVTHLAPIAAAKILSIDSLELLPDEAETVYLIKAEGAEYVAYRVGATYGFVSEKDEPQFTDEAAMLTAFVDDVRAFAHG